MKIYKINDKRAFMPLLLLGDEQESMIEKYIDRSEIFVLDDCGIKGEITVCNNGGGVLEIKNIAVYPQFQKLGYGKALINFVAEKFKNDFSELLAGTGDSPLTLPFYEKCGFVKVHTVKNFFTENYTAPIIEGGVVLKDMVYLKKSL